MPGELGSPGVADHAVAVSDASRSDARRIGEAAYRERLTLAPETLSGVRDVLVGEAYVAASGRRCRRLLQDDGMPLERVVCGVGDDWRVVRSLSSRAVDGRVLPVAPVVPVVE